MKTKYSPGPWDVHGSAVGSTFYVHGANRICDITKPSGFYCPPAESEANALLISKSPELFNAVVGLLSIFDSVTQGQERELRQEWLPTARALIKKLKGIK